MSFIYTLIDFNLVRFVRYVKHVLRYVIKNKDEVITDYSTLLVT